MPKDLTGPSTSLSTIRFTSAPIDVYTRANLLLLLNMELLKYSLPLEDSMRVIYYPVTRSHQIFTFRLTRG